MSAKRFSCTKDCEWYSFESRRCKLGKVNSTTIKGGVEAVESNFVSAEGGAV